VVSRLDPLRFDGGDIPPIAGLNAALSSSRLTGCGPVSGPSSLKHRTYKTADLFGSGSAQYQGVAAAWSAVNVN
jgi:hypothetical protein